MPSLLKRNLTMNCLNQPSFIMIKVRENQIHVPFIRIQKEAYQCSGGSNIIGSCVENNYRLLCIRPTKSRLEIIRGLKRGP